MIVRGNALNIPLAGNSVHCVVTSPPYWGLRKYQGEQLTEFPDGPCAFGLEPTIEQYVEHSILILREVHRVLRDDGVCWWNLGDSYATSPAGNKPGSRSGFSQTRPSRSGDIGEYNTQIDWRTSGLKPLDLCLIPERVALAAQADGWYVRSLVIWAKPNPMPESVNGWRWERHRVRVKSRGYRPEPMEAGQPSNVEARNDQAQWADCPGCDKCSPNEGLALRKGSWRPTDAYEHILMLAKSADYFGDAEEVKESHSVSTLRMAKYSQTWRKSAKRAGESRSDSLSNPVSDPTGRNLRNVWTFPTQPYPEAHFATFPERLPEICIKASTSEKGCCPKCGACWVRVIERTGHVNLREPAHVPDNSPTKTDSTGWKHVTRATETWRPSCSCNAGEPVPCTVLDPFGGSGTTARVATELGRRAVSLDIAYHDLASKRTTEIQPWMIFA